MASKHSDEVRKGRKAVKELLDEASSELPRTPHLLKLLVAFKHGKRMRRSCPTSLGMLLCRSLRLRAPSDGEEGRIFDI